jgi:hypothetical protein
MSARLCRRKLLITDNVANNIDVTVLALMGLEFLGAFSPPDAATSRVTNIHLISNVIKHHF